MHCRGIEAHIDLAAGEYVQAAETLRALCEVLARWRMGNELATRSADLAEALYCLGDFDEAEEWTRVSDANAASDYLGAQVSWRPVLAKILARRGDSETAEEMIRDALRLSSSSDGLNRAAKIERDLGEVLLLKGEAKNAAAAFRRAVALYEQKGNTVAIARTLALRDEPVLA
jgi:tetratricopeptide (TPR) repeat protein